MRRRGIVFGTVLVGLLSATPELLAQEPTIFATPPVAIVLEASPETGLSAYDSIHPGLKVDLRPAYQLHVRYTQDCLEKVITGGRVSFRKQGRKLRKKAQVEVLETPCARDPAPKDKDGKDTFEAAQALSPFPQQAWQERLIRSSQPVFQWPMGTQVEGVTLSLLDLDQPVAATIWTSDVSSNHLLYPADAPGLQPGRPYRVDVTYPGGMTRSMTFSIDPGLAIPDTIGNRLVSVSW